MRLQDQVGGAHIVLAAVLEELDLEPHEEREHNACQPSSSMHRQRRRSACTVVLTDLLTVVGQPSSSTGPLSVSLIL